VPEFTPGEGMRRDLFLIERGSARQALAEIVSLVAERLPTHYGVDPVREQSREDRVSADPSISARCDSEQIVCRFGRTHGAEVRDTGVDAGVHGADVRAERDNVSVSEIGYYAHRTGEALV